MSHYKSNLRDIEFNLFELLGRQEVLGTGPFAEIDEETARDMLAEVNKLALGPVAESFADGDRNPPVFDPATGAVTLPESFKKSYRALMDAEWWRLSVSPELGGTAAPRSLQWGIASFILGAHPALWMYCNGPTFAQILLDLGTPEQQRFAKLAVERGWGATMVLTEPDAGSDVGAGRAKAIQQPDGSWHIEGVKRFITGAEQDLTENIFHLVLARPEGAAPGTKGLSMFLVPKYHVNPDGSLGERNGVKVTNVEHKMGLKVSTTCELTFGGDPGRPAVGTLVGGVHEGIKQMFMVIEHARMLVGFKAIETLSTGYLNALDYAKNRVQGPDLTQADRQGLAARADHPAPRRAPDAHAAEGVRGGHAGAGALHGRAAGRRAGRRVQRHAGRGRGGAQRPAAAGRQGRSAPSGRTRCSRCHCRRSAAPASCRTTRWSSTSGTRRSTPCTRARPRSSRSTSSSARWSATRGRAVKALLAEVAAFAAAEDDQDGQLKTERAAIAEGVTQVEAMLSAMTGFLIGSFEQPEEVYKIGQQSVRLLLAFGDLVVAWLLGRQAEVAGRALASTRTR